MKYFTSLLFCLWLIMPQQLTAQNSQFSEIRQSIETAVDSLQPDRLIALNTRLRNMAEDGDPQVRKYAHYYRGYSNYRLNSSFPNIKEDQKEKYLEQAVKMLEEALEIDPEFAEAQALLGSCYGQMADGIFSGMKYGPKSEKAMEKAKELAPDNPRVVMLDAIGTLFKPSMFGGSTEGAIKGFERAAGLFENWQPPNVFAPRWGHAEVYAWLGQAYAMDEQYEKARKAYREALKVKPGYPWVKDLLLPELNKNTE